MEEALFVLFFFFLSNLMPAAESGIYFPQTLLCYPGVGRVIL